MGNAAGCLPRSSRRAVHPHVHGERRISLCFWVGSAGSSPRTWGTPPGDPAGSTRVQFIPTYMGNAFASAVAFDMLCGSSPRTWGTLGVDPAARAPPRFIPTYMGNAESPLGFFCPVSVHPHVHGERWRALGGLGAVAGSSPRTWGTPIGDAVKIGLLRFIPTYMGNAVVSL